MSGVRLLTSAWSIGLCCLYLLHSQIREKILRKVKKYDAKIIFKSMLGHSRALIFSDIISLP